MGCYCSRFPDGDLLLRHVCEVVLVEVPCSFVEGRKLKILRSRMIALPVSVVAMIDFGTWRMKSR